MIRALRRGGHVYKMLTTVSLSVTSDPATHFLFPNSDCDPDPVTFCSTANTNLTSMFCYFDVMPFCTHLNGWCCDDVARFSLRRGMYICIYFSDTSQEQWFDFIFAFISHLSAKIKSVSGLASGLIFKSRLIKTGFLFKHTFHGAS